MKTVAFIVISPLLGFILGSLIMLGCRGCFPHRAEQGRPVVPPPAAGVGGLYSLGHGGNDAQKTIGIIWMLLIAPAMRRRRDAPPCGSALLSGDRLGTLFGGWRIVRTMGQKITKLKPVGGFCAETAARSRCSSRRPGHAGVDHAHHHRRHRRRRLGAEDVGRALGRGGQHRVGLGADDPGLGADRRRRLVDRRRSSDRDAARVA
jgi:hypothetical protein